MCIYGLSWPFFLVIFPFLSLCLSCSEQVVMAMRSQGTASLHQAGFCICRVCYYGSTYQHQGVTWWQDKAGDEVTQITLDAFADENSFIYLQCSGMVSIHRRDDHYAYWFSVFFLAMTWQTCLIRQHPRLVTSIMHNNKSLNKRLFLSCLLIFSLPLSRFMPQS